MNPYKVYLQADALNIAHPKYSRDQIAAGITVPEGFDSDDMERVIKLACSPGKQLTESEFTDYLENGKRVWQTAKVLFPDYVAIACRRYEPNGEAI